VALLSLSIDISTKRWNRASWATSMICRGGCPVDTTNGRWGKKHRVCVPIFSVTYDEELCLNAIGVQRRLMIELWKYPCMERDYKYVRQGILKVLAGIDLGTWSL